MDLVHEFYSFYRRKQTLAKVHMVLHSTAVHKNVFTNLNTVNLMLPQLLKWGVKLKPAR